MAAQKDNKIKLPTDEEITNSSDSKLRDYAVNNDFCSFIIL